MNTSTSSGAFHVVDGIARLIGLALFALLPFFIIPASWSSIAQGKMLLVAVLVAGMAAVWLVARLLEGAVHVPRSVLLYAAALLPAAYLLSMLVSGFSQSALVGQGIEQDTLAASVLWFSAFALSAMLLFGNQAAIRLAVQAFLGGLTVLLVFQSLYILMPEWFSLGLLSGETTNLFGSWHDLGIIAGLSLFLASSLAMSGLTAGWQRIVLGILILASLFLIIVIHFKDIFFATAALFALAGLVVMRTGEAHAGLSYARALQNAAPFLLAAVVLGAGGFVGAGVWEKLPDRINIVQTEVRPSWQGTFDTARQSLQAPQDLVFGSGPNSFVREWGKNKPVEVNLTPFWNADFSYGVGIIPTSIFTAGLFGIVAWGAIFLALLALAGRYLREMRPLSTSRVLFGLTLLAVVYLIGYHLIYTPSVAVTGILFLLLGLLVATAAGDQPARALRIGAFGASESVRLILVIVVILAGIAGAALVAREVVSNLFVNRAAYAYQGEKDIARAGSNIATALLISPNNDRAHRAAAELGVVRLAQMIQANPQDEAGRAALQETLQNTIQHGLTAVSINENNYQNWLLLAQVYADLAGADLEGALAAAKNAYEKAFEASPKNPVPKLRLAQLAAASGDKAAARTYLQEAIALKQDFAAAYYLLSQVEAADGKGDEAVRAASTAVQLVQDDPLGWYNLGYILYMGEAYEAAGQAFQNALQRAPDYSNALFYLGLTAYQLGQLDIAIQAFGRVEQLNPQETWVVQVKENVRAGRDPMDGVQQPQQ
jgi:tetratricopeptide (TPR) repeat protein